MIARYDEEHLRYKSTNLSPAGGKSVTPIVAPFWITAEYCEKYGDPYGTRTRVYAVKGRRPRPLDEGVTGQEVYWSNAGGSRYESKNCRPIGNFFPDTGHIYQVDRSPQRYHSYLIDIK